jgi:predicted RNase H-like HicB family nuclease
MEYTAIVKKMGNGYYFAQCEQLPSAMTQGKTIDEAKENLRDAISLVLEDEKADFQKLHFGLGFSRRKVAVA